MTEILGVPLKKTSELDLIKPFKNLISLRFSSAENPENFTEAITELQKLRNNAVLRALDKNEASIEFVAKYCDQLQMLEGKIPPQDLQIAFKWKDAFDKGSLFGGKMSLTIPSISYERMCCLFNLAAFQSQVAGCQNIENDEGLKLAAKLLQQAAGIFSYMKGIVMAALQQEPTPDLNPETLAALSALMLAEAQEIFVLKAINDQMKDAITAKLSAQCEEYYSEALKLMQREGVRSMWDRDWLPKITSKQSAYQAIAEFFQSRVCNAKKSVGEEIARLQRAIELFKTAQQRSGDLTLHQSYINQAQRALADAQKDNDFIYHERIPDAKHLDAIGKAPLAKITPIPERLSSNFKDLFEGLTPVVIHQALVAWDVRKMELINVEVGRLREATQMLNGILASMNLPAALEESEGESVPQSLKDKARDVRQAGGINHVKSLIDELPCLLTRNREILDEAERLLTEEKQSDEQLKVQFKDRWNRTPSAKLTEGFNSNIAKYRQILANAANADDVVKGKFETHRRGIELLSRSEQELEGAVPSACQATADNSRSPAAAQLRQMMVRVAEIKSEREAIENELKSSTVDMKSLFLNALAQDGAINEPVMSVEKLGQIYGPLQKRTRDSVELQVSLISQIQHLNEEFTKDKAGSKGSSAREDLLKELATAHDIYMEVQNNLEEGAKFYNDLTQLLLSCQSKISDFCFARKAEKEELLKDLTSTLATSASAAATSAPSLPAHHANAPPGNSRDPPVRPPPPSMPSAPSAAPQLTQPHGPMQTPQSQGQEAHQNPHLPYPMYPAYMPMPMPYYQQAVQGPPNYAYPNPTAAAPPSQYPNPYNPGQYPSYSYPYYNTSYPYAPHPPQ